MRLVGEFIILYKAFPQLIENFAVKNRLSWS